MNKPVYVLGTGISHDGSSCLLKDGKIIVAIEKERLTRIKHDGGNDSLTVQYCLDNAGITVDDLSLVVQCANFEKDEIKKDRYKGQRLFPTDCPVLFVTISHHLARAYRALVHRLLMNAVSWSLTAVVVFIISVMICGVLSIPSYTNSQPGLYGEKEQLLFF